MDFSESQTAEMEFIPDSLFLSTALTSSTLSSISSTTPISPRITPAQQITSSLGHIQIMLFSIFGGVVGVFLVCGIIVIYVRLKYCQSKKRYQQAKETPFSISPNSEKLEELTNFGISDAHSSAPDFGIQVIINGSQQTAASNGLQTTAATIDNHPTAANSCSHKTAAINGSQQLTAAKGGQKPKMIKSSQQPTASNGSQPSLENNKVAQPSNGHLTERERKTAEANANRDERHKKRENILP